MLCSVCHTCVIKNFFFSNDLNKIAKVILNRMTLDENSAASSLQTMGNILNVSDSSRSSRLCKRKKADYIEVSDSSSSSSDRSASKENIDTSNKNVMIKKEKKSASFRDDGIIANYKRMKAKINTRRLPSSSSGSSSKSDNSENDTSTHQNIRQVYFDLL